MVARVIQSAVLVALITLTLTGCGRQVSKEPSQDSNLLATGPAGGAFPTPRPFVVAAIDAAGGRAAWQECRKIEFDAIVTACRPDGSYYLTEHSFAVYPWSDAIRLTAHEPHADCVWQVVGGQYQAPQADQSLDVSPLSTWYGHYADAVLQIVTAPVQMVESSVVLARRPAPVQINGQWYLPLDAKYRASKAIMPQKGRKAIEVEPYRTQGTYFQNQDKSLVDMIWLGNPAAQKFLLVRGYDYAKLADNSVLIPTKIEVFQSGPEATCGPRLALIDLKQ